MNLSHAEWQSLQSGLQLLEAAPPELRSEIPRIERLRLQRVVLAALPTWQAPMPFTIWWRRHFCWSDDAIVSVGTVAWEQGQAMFAVDRARCTLRTAPLALPAHWLLALHLGERTVIATAV